MTVAAARIAARLHAATRGWKTHAVAAAAVALALLAHRYGLLTGPETFARVEEALLGSTLRSAVATTCRR